MLDGMGRPPTLPPGAEPPSASKARLWTFLAVSWLWFLLPVAVHYQRQARREAEASGGRYAWPRTLTRRPVLLWFLFMTVSLGGFLLVGMLVGYGP
jgi:hypothetical protein